MGLAALVVAVVGFGIDSMKDDTEPAAAPAATTAPVEEEATPVGELASEIAISGSSTVFPIVQLQAERFEEIAPGVAISVDNPGSGDGAQLFCRGDVQITNASRLFKPEEVALCEEQGIEFIEIRRAVDGITLITSPANAEIDCVSFNDLYAWSPRRPRVSSVGLTQTRSRLNGTEPSSPRDSNSMCSVRVKSRAPSTRSVRS